MNTKEIFRRIKKGIENVKKIGYFNNIPLSILKYNIFCRILQYVNEKY